MRVGLVIGALLVMLVGTGFYAGMQIASLTGHAVSTPYLIREQQDSGSGTELTLQGVALMGSALQVHLAVRDVSASPHTLRITVQVSTDHAVVGTVTQELSVTSALSEEHTLSVPLSSPVDGLLHFLIMGVDVQGTRRIEGELTADSAVAPSSLSFLGVAFLGFFGILGLLFLIARRVHMLYRVKHMTRHEAEGLISLS